MSILTAGIVIETKDLWDELQGALPELPVRVLLEQPEVGDWNTFLERLERLRPEVVFLDTTKLKDAMADSIRRIKSISCSPAVFALATDAKPETILAAMRAGASEFLYPPFAEHLAPALERVGAEQKRSSPVLRRGGRTIGFVSAKGGCGATTVVCHTAVELPRYTKGRVLLADLDIEAGLISFLLKTNSPYNFMDAAKNTHRLDETYWRALVSNGISGLEVITAPAPPAKHSLRPEHLKSLISFMRSQYDWVLIDLGRSLSNFSTSAIEDMDELFVVTTLEIPALHQAQLIIRRLIEGGYGRERVRLLINRSPKRYELTLDELASMLGVPVYATIPNDYGTLSESYAEGKLLPPSSSLAKHFSRLAMKIGGVDNQEKKKFSLFG